MKLKIEMSEDEIRRACAAWAQKNMPDALRNPAAIVELHVTERFEGPMEQRAGHNILAVVHMEVATDGSR